MGGGLLFKRCVNFSSDTSANGLDTERKTTEEGGKETRRDSDGGDESDEVDDDNDDRDEVDKVDADNDGERYNEDGREARNGRDEGFSPT